MLRPRSISWTLAMEVDPARIGIVAEEFSAGGLRNGSTVKESNDRTDFDKYYRCC